MPRRTMSFGPLSVTFDEHVLEPRPWTLAQSTWAAELGAEAPAGPLLELCAGAGHIGQAAAALGDRPLVQVDLDPHACELAAANAAVNLPGRAVDVRCGDLDAVLAADERFPIVLADPPYLPSSESDGWPDDPALAVDGGDDGLALPRRCLATATRHLADGGAVLLQALGRTQVLRLGADIAGLGLRVDEVREIDDRRAIALLRRRYDR
jgi:methylase of polypeptide subunit release factors